MLNVNVNRKITLFILMMMVLICGLSSLSYGQEDDSLTFSNVTCKASNVDHFIGGADVTVTGTILANRAVTDVEGWLTINGTVMSGGGFPAIRDPITNTYYGGRSFGNFSEGQTKSFSITSVGVWNVDNNTACGFYFTWINVDTPPQSEAEVPTEPEVLVVDPDAPPIYWTDAGKIKHVNLDGSNVEDIVTGLDDLIGIALDVSGSKMYWVDFGTQKIQRANFNGTNVEDIGGGGVSSITLDVTGGKIYWTTRTSASTIRRANLDGSNVKDLITRGLNAPNGIALDVAEGKMYWTDGGADKIQRANLDGSNVEDIVTGLTTPRGIALDVAGGKMYWTDGGADKIQRANLDGTNVEDLVTGLDEPVGITLAIPPQAIPSTPDLVVEAVQAVPSTVEPGETFRLYATLKNQGRGESAATRIRYYRSSDATISTQDTQLRSANRDPLAANATIRRYLTVTAPTTPGTYYYGACVDSVSSESDTANNCSIALSVTVTAPPVVSEDVNEDGVVDVQDLVSVARRYGQTGTNSADVNGDGVVNRHDLILVAAVLNVDAAAAPSLHSDALDLFSVADIKLWLSQAYQGDLTDPSVRKGILFLEQLLAILTPKETTLLANYPNPFNPETWIPYQLSTFADVTLTIYAVDGQMVQRLALGHQPAGTYQNRSRAAYWDGRNAFGESVASGVYFYTLTAGDFSATRKMLIRK